MEFPPLLVFGKRFHIKKRRGLSSFNISTLYNIYGQISFCNLSCRGFAWPFRFTCLLQDVSKQLMQSKDESSKILIASLLVDIAWLQQVNEKTRWKNREKKKPDFFFFNILELLYLNLPKEVAKSSHLKNTHLKNLLQLTCAFLGKNKCRIFK